MVNVPPGTQAMPAGRVTAGVAALRTLAAMRGSSGVPGPRVITPAGWETTGRTGRAQPPVPGEAPRPGRAPLCGAARRRRARSRPDRRREGPDVRSSEGPEGGKKSRPARLAAAVRGALADVARGGERLLERHRRRPLVDLGLRIYERDRDMAGTVVGSAVAFRLFLFFVPLLLFVAGVVGVLGAYIDTGDVSEAGISGGLASQIGTALSQPESTRWAAVGIGALGMLTTGRSLSKTMVAASCLAWQVPV